jgi:hypothetical protein
MSAGSSGAFAAAAAAEQARRMRQEEEEMTGYRPDELAGDWEFKILRSTTGAFKKQERLRQCLEEEARAGWVLVEKFDNSRLRLKRPASARDLDGKLDFDPYRTQVGMTEGTLALTIVGVVVGVLLAVFALIALIANA